MDKEFLNQIDRVDEMLATINEKLDGEALICECFCVSAKDIREHCFEIGKVDLDTLKRNLGLGEGCQNCVKSFESWSNKIF